MASFKDQVENYAGTINSEDYLTALDNGVKDVVNRMMKISPDSMFMFASVVTNSAGSGSVAITDTDKILDVSRKNDNSVARNCVEVPASLRGEVSDATSLHKATKEYPVYYKLNGNLTVAPATTTASVIHVNKVVYGAVSNAHTNSSAIADFPTGMVPLVILYASAQVLLEKMAEYSGLPNDLNFTSLLSAAVDVPSAPSFSVSKSSFNNGGEFDSTIFDLPALSDLPSISSVTSLVGSDGLDIDIAMGTLDNDTDEIDPKKWFGVLSEFIENEEDIELSRAQVEKITSFVSWYQQALAENLQKFNSDWATYSAKLTNALQIMFKETDTAIQKYASDLQRFQADWQRVAQEVNSNVQQFNSKLQKATTDYKWMADRYVFVMQEYEKSFQPYADKGEPAN
jgi:hypothetical protein